jgi:hypothetical protein
MKAFEQVLEEPFRIVPNETTSLALGDESEGFVLLR